MKELQYLLSGFLIIELFLEVLFVSMRPRGTTLARSKFWEGVSWVSTGVIFYLLCTDTPFTPVFFWSSSLNFGFSLLHSLDNFFYNSKKQAEGGKPNE